MNTQKLLQDTTDFLQKIHRLKKDDIFLLRSVIKAHNSLYHEEESPIISDLEYDQLFHALAKLEADHNMLDKDSPTAQLAILTSQQFEKIKHRYPMISLDNTYNTDDIRDFESRMRNILKEKSPEKFEYYIQPKYDGLGVALIYKYGVLDLAITRGSGVEGENITLGAKEITNIPKKIDAIEKYEYIEVRGEVVMPNDVFEKVNQKRMEDGKKLFANPRNAASGSLRQINPLITRERKLQFFAYSLPQVEKDEVGIVGFDILSYHDLVGMLRKWGFECADYGFGIISGVENLIKIIEEKTKKYLENTAEDFNFDTDGIVLKADDMQLWHLLGHTAHHPRYSIAYKFPAKQVRSQVLSIEHSIGRTGTITPVANLEPTPVTGVIVRRVTLHNYDELAKKDVRIGDYVYISRAGEVIPEIISVIESVRSGEEEKVFPPKNCPMCQSELIQDEGKVAIYCPNRHCPAKVQGQLEMFVSKQGLNIDGFGIKQIELFLDTEIIDDFASIFEIEKYREKILSFEGYKQKSVDNLLKAIETARHTTLARIFTAIGILGVGKKTAQVLEKYMYEKNGFEPISIDFLRSISAEELENIKDIGPETAKGFVRFFEENDARIEALLEKLDIQIPEKQETTENTKLSGKIFCVTGSFENMSRDQIHDWIEKNGGQIRTSVSKALDYLVVGEKAGSKQKKAETLGVQCILLSELFEMGG
ncbi:NAD-dependent DNA ligase LigA [Candidatus Gracilibacteria bacterium]|nr:NAD-dependent DNA ligase LigA [Candidatus Gracilibacteria bacterium]MBS9783749.1 NAD-dependent DNA ligase LigA [Candidatus Gracilibacteria bacterium]